MLRFFCCCWVMQKKVNACAAHKFNGILFHFMDFFPNVLSSAVKSFELLLQLIFFNDEPNYASVSFGLINRCLCSALNLNKNQICHVQCDHWVLSFIVWKKMKRNLAMNCIPNHCDFKCNISSALSLVGCIRFELPFNFIQFMWLLFFLMCSYHIFFIHLP